MPDNWPTILRGATWRSETRHIEESFLIVGNNNTAQLEYQDLRWQGEGGVTDPEVRIGYKGGRKL